MQKQLRAFAAAFAKFGHVEDDTADADGDADAPDHARPLSDGRLRGAWLRGASAASRARLLSSSEGDWAFDDRVARRMAFVREQLRDKADPSIDAANAAAPHFYSCVALRMLPAIDTVMLQLCGIVSGGDGISVAAGATALLLSLLRRYWHSYAHHTARSSLALALLSSLHRRPPPRPPPSASPSSRCALRAPPSSPTPPPRPTASHRRLRAGRGCPSARKCARCGGGGVGRGDQAQVGARGRSDARRRGPPRSRSRRRRRRRAAAAVADADDDDGAAAAGGGAIGAATARRRGGAASVGGRDAGAVEAAAPVGFPEVTFEPGAAPRALLAARLELLVVPQRPPRSAPRSPPALSHEGGHYNAAAPRRRAPAATGRRRSPRLAAPAGLRRAPRYTLGRRRRWWRRCTASASAARTSRRRRRSACSTGCGARRRPRRRRRGAPPGLAHLDRHGGGRAARRRRAPPRTALRVAPLLVGALCERLRALGRGGAAAKGATSAVDPSRTLKRSSALKGLSVAASLAAASEEAYKADGAALEDLLAHVAWGAEG